MFSGGIEGSQQYKICQVTGSCQMLLDVFFVLLFLCSKKIVKKKLLVLYIHLVDR